MIARKLRIKDHDAVAFVGNAHGYALELPKGATLVSSGKAAAVIAFVVMGKDVERTLKTASARVKDGGLLWFAYPKAKQLGTDLNRDILARALHEAGHEPVALVSLDDQWSALRLRVDASLAEARRARGAFEASGKKTITAKEMAAAKAKR